MRIHHGERRYRLSLLSVVLLSSTGMLISLLATALEAVPRLRLTKHVTFSTLEPDGSLETRDLDLDTYWMGHRRLQKPSSSFNAVSGVNHGGEHQNLGVMQHDMLSTLSVHTSPCSHTRSLFETSVLEQEDEETILPESYIAPSESSSSWTTKAVDGTMPMATLLSIVLFSVSGTIFFCAFLVYLSDLYERFQYKLKRNKHQQQRNDNLLPHSDTIIEHKTTFALPQSVGSSISQLPDSGEYCEEGVLFTIDREQSCNASLSAVSSMTNSLAVEEDYYETDDEEDELDVSCCVVGGLELVIETQDVDGLTGYMTDLEEAMDQVGSSAEVQELSSEAESMARAAVDSHQSVIEIKLSTDCMMPTKEVGPEITITNKKKRASNFAEQMVEEAVFDEERDADHSRESDNDDQLRADADRSIEIADGEAVPAEEYIRDIFFVPIQSSSQQSTSELLDTTLGLDVQDAYFPVTHPCILQVKQGSPLQSRVFAGDFILSINDKDTTGLTAQQIYAMTRTGAGDSSAFAKMVKLTVMSSQSDAGSDCSTMDGAMGQSKPTMLASRMELGLVGGSFQEV